VKKKKMAKVSRHGTVRPSNHFVQGAWAAFLAKNHTKNSD